MAPHDPFHSQIYALARAVAAIVANPDAPDLLRREMRKLVRKLRKKLPKDARREIGMAEAEATIKASGYLRLSDGS